MEIKILQNQYGKFNWAWHNQSTVFSVWLYDDWVLVTRWENKAILYTRFDDCDMTDRNEQIFEEFGIDEIYHYAQKYSKMVWGTTDYKWNVALFVEVFNKNKEQILENFKLYMIQEVQKKIDSLQNKISHIQSLSPISL